MGGFYFRESGEGAHAIGDGVSAIGRKIQPLESAAAAFGQAHGVRRAGQLEANLRELFGVLSLSAGASGTIQADALRFSGE